MRQVHTTELQLNFIWTRLLEQPNSGFQATYKMARSLEATKKQSQSYPIESVSCSSAIPVNHFRVTTC